MATAVWHGLKAALLCAALVLSLLTAGSHGQVNVIGKWTTLPNLMPINPIHVALLHTGKILVVAGSGNCPPSKSGCPLGPPYGAANHAGAGLYDPTTGSFTQFSVSWDMFCNSMVVLPDGRVFINGGSVQYDPFLGSPKSSIFDPATNTFTDVQNMAHGRWYPTVTNLGDGRVMTFSGFDENGTTNTTMEFYTPGSGWSQPYVAGWTPPLYPRMHLLPNGQVFYSSPGQRSRIFNPATTTWTTSVLTNFGAVRGYGSSVLLPLTPGNGYNPRIMILGGHNPATDTTEIINLGASSPAWVYASSMSQARIEMNAVVLPNGKVLALGGSVNDEDTTSKSLNADLIDPNADVAVNRSAGTSSAGANAFARLYHSVALLLPDATVWFAGSNPVHGSYEQHMEIYKPAYFFNSIGALATRPTISSAPTSVTWGNQFTVQTPDAASIASVILMRPGSPTHAFDQEQRMVGMSFTRGSGALTVTAPPNSNIAPSGYYMLFIINSSGVPSVAPFVRLEAKSQQDFTLAATPSSQTVPRGKSTSYNVNVTALNGFTGGVALSVSGLPSGATASFSPSSLAGSGSSTLNISTSSSVVTGSYALTINGTSGNLTHSVQVKLVVADFSISASPASQSVSGNAKATYTVTITKLGPFSSTVNFTVSGLPPHTTASFNPGSVAGSGTTTLTVSAKKARRGSYSLTITGIGGGLTHSTVVALVIQ